VARRVRLGVGVWGRVGAVGLVRLNRHPEGPTEWFESREVWVCYAGVYSAGALRCAYCV
jgi:hypothetical protein